MKTVIKRSKRNTRSRKSKSRRVIKNTNTVGGPNTATATCTFSSPLDQNEYYEEIIDGVDQGAGSRIVQIAQNYGLYRISKVVMKFKPKFDTYTPGNAPPGSSPSEVPYLYWIMDRYGDLLAPSTVNPSYFLNQGAKAIRFDDKTLSVSFRPNVILDVTNRQIKMTPWLTTDNAGGTQNWTPSDSAHHGIVYGVLGGASGSTNGPVGTVETTVYYQFKNPLYDLPGDSNTVRVKVAPNTYKYIADASNNVLEV